MKAPRRDTHGPIGFDMTPMIDIVFQLIIFFLLTGHMVKQETKMKLPLPVATTGEKDLHEDAARLTINIQGNGRINLGAGPIQLSELILRLQEKRATAGADLEVRIRSDRHVPYQFVQPILLACAKNGIWKVVFAVNRPEDARR